MPKTIYPANNAEFLIWLINFISVAIANKTVLELSEAQTDDLTAKKLLFSTQLNEQQAKKEASVAATTLVGTSRKDLNTLVGALNIIFKLNKSIPLELLEELGLDSGSNLVSSNTLFAPVDLVVTGTSDGTNSVKFAGNGNKDRTNYVIEAKIGAALTYAFVAVTTKKRFLHKNQTPGVRVFYRVKAVNGDLESGYSNEAVIYN
jgi:hypothetical protein